MSKTQRSTNLTRLLFAVAVGVIPIGLSCASTRCLAQDYGGGQDPGGLEMPNLGPDDFDLTPRRGSRTKMAKKSQLAKKADAAAKAKAGGARRIRLARTKSNSQKRLLPYWSRIALGATLEINVVRDAENSI